MESSAALPVGVGATELSDGCGLPEATGSDTGAAETLAPALALTGLDSVADPAAPPEVGALEAGAEITAADEVEEEDVSDEVELAVPVEVELHPAISRQAAAAHARGVRMTEVIMAER